MGSRRRDEAVPRTDMPSTAVPTSTAVLTSTAVPGGAVEELDDEIGPKDRQRFVTVLRGYDRIEVDECLGRIAASVRVLRDELTAQRAVANMQPRPEPEPAAGQMASDHVASGQVMPGQPEGSFGVRAERLLRLAEAEAREIRVATAGEASALLEQARVDAERIRHDREQALIDRSAVQDREHAKRMSDLQQREQRIAQQLSAINTQAEEARAVTRRDIDAMHQQAQSELAETRKRVAAQIARHTDQARNEVERLDKLSAVMRGDLRRLTDTLVAELGEPELP